VTLSTEARSVRLSPDAAVALAEGLTWMEQVDTLVLADVPGDYAAKVTALYTALVALL
jgi:hypothetical protein